MKIVFTIEDNDDGTTDARLELHGCEIMEALEIIKDAQEEMLHDRISMN